VLDRRTFVKRLSQAAAAATAAAFAPASIEAAQTPNSSGTARPRTAAPVNAADCHAHIYDVHFQSAIPALPNATVPDYRVLQQRIGTSRVVIVTPRNYVVDNTVTLDALRQFGANARGIAVVRPEVTDRELKRLQERGIRGIRFTVADPSVAVVSIGMIEPLAKRIAALGWHVQLNMNREQIVENAALLRRLPVPMVFDHLASLSAPEGIEHPAYAVIRSLIDKRRTWVKLSGAYIRSVTGSPYADVASVAQTFVKIAPERVVWGSDWPHPSETEQKPDDALLFDLLATWAPDEKIRNRILVQNPEALYGFTSRT
jgi:predicted TIM-barrel fold metal-dependent hydrolase